ncbi:MAG: hypothetical protein P4L10_17155 [Acidobacteriaceae bacterium]|jgi:hypothetical protein|nr:hypothetical protein [Acidobacteriaceae bacterium]
MTRIPYIISGVFTAMALWVVYQRSQKRPVAVLAHRLEEAWADHHTRV